MDLQTTEMLKKIVLSGKEYLSTETLMDSLPSVIVLYIITGKKF